MRCRHWSCLSRRRVNFLSRSQFPSGGTPSGVDQSFFGGALLSSKWNAVQCCGETLSQGQERKAEKNKIKKRSNQIKKTNPRSSQRATAAGTQRRDAFLAAHDRTRQSDPAVALTLMTGVRCLTARAVEANCCCSSPFGSPVARQQKFALAGIKLKTFISSPGLDY